MDEPKKLSLLALSVEDLAMVYDKISRGQFNREWLEESLALGAPRNPDGTINLIDFIAWHVREERLDRERRKGHATDDRDPRPQREPPG